MSMYAVLEAGGKQYRVKQGDELNVERLQAEPGNSFTFDRVLFVSDAGKATIGSPTIAKATVVADVVKHLRGPKLITFKMKRRKGYHKTIGHRQELTRVRIAEIKL
jgi:large subunit ribosomal protein L21